MDTPAAITVRDAAVADAVADAEALARMMNALAVVTEGRPGSMTAEHVVDLSRQPGVALLLAERSGAPAGYALVLPAYETAHAARGLYVADLFVQPEARRNGVARALLAEVARRSQALGGRFLWLVSNPEDARANAFYDGLSATRDLRLCRAVIDADLAALAG